MMPILEVNFNTRNLHLVTTPRAGNDPSLHIWCFYQQPTLILKLHTFGLHCKL